MNTNDWISMHVIVENIYSNPMMIECPEDFVINKIVQLTGVIGIPSMFEQKEASIEIIDNKGKLPCDFYEIKSVVLDECNHVFQKCGLNIESLKNQKKDTQDELNIILSRPLSKDDKYKIKELEDKIAFLTSSIDRYEHPSTYKTKVNSKGRAFVSRTDNFDPSSDESGTLDYRISGGNIITSIQSGRISISYIAMAVDEDGYPMIINNESYKRALEQYVTVEWYKILFAQNKININAVTMIENDYQWSVARATSSLRTPTYDQMESISRILNSLLPTDSHKSTFHNLHSLNTLKTH